MIPTKILRFLDQDGNLAFAGTRSHDLVPHGHRVSGWRASTDGLTLTAFINEHSTAQLIESLEDNDSFAMTIEQFPTHETYQFKGRYLGQRPIIREDIEVVDRIRARLVKSFRPLYPHAPDVLADWFVGTPCLAVEFRVEEIYLQTPGPGAGARLVPEEEKGSRAR